MDAAESLLHGIVYRLSAWLPGAAAAACSSPRMSREFWMPDRSCRVCYDCESQFTIFNRRHHCRICGRVFCGKCTVNAAATRGSTVVVAEEDGERIKVCKFCFKLTQHSEEASGCSSEPTLTPTSSISSLFSTNTSGASMASPTAAASQGVGGNGSTSTSEDKQEERQENQGLLDTSLAMASSFYSRSDDEEENTKDARVRQDLDGMETDTDAKLSSQGSVSEHSQGDGRNRGEEVKGNGSTERLSSSASRRSCDEMESFEDENFHGQLYEATYGTEVDFENNKLVWIPPLPEEDEEDAGPGYDDEDDDDEGCWGLPRSSGSFSSSSDYRSRERAASEEHRKAMRSVVDGHFRALVAQLLKGEDIPVDDEDEDNWLETVTSLALQAASIVKPDSSRGGSMDPGGYVKVKCIASGRRSDSTIVKGIVCKKNLAHKRMTTRFKNPRLLLLGGALEYQRVSNHFSSVDTLLQQEKDYLNMAAARIEAHHPNVVIVEQGVARFAQDRLLSKEISLVLKVKRPLLERIARCTGAQVVSSPDHLSNPKSGHCEFFHTEKFFEEHGSAGQGGKPLTKTLMFFEGCPKPLGCTALLRGANGDDLKKIKRVLQLSVFAAYHLALETSFLADEGATLPDHRSPIIVTLPTKQSSSDRSITSVAGFAVPDAQLRPQTSQAGSDVNDLKGDWKLALSQVSGLSASLKAFADEGQGFFSTGFLEPSMNSELMTSTIEESANGDKPHDPEDADDEHGKDDFPPTPSDHQSILVSLSTRCITKSAVCERPNIVRIKYYGNSDKPLGRFLRDTLFDPNNRCPHCEEPPDAHIRCYTHRLGSLTISVRRLETDHVLPGERDGKIWMWHRCLKCPRVDGIPPVTRRIVMSDAAWGLSFGKFLELSFSNHAAVSRVAACGHSLHRDCLRFYGFGTMIACFRYAAVHLHAVHLPPAKLEFHDSSQQDWLRKEAQEVALKGELVFAEILDALRVIGEHIASSGSFAGSGRIAEVRRRAVHLELMFQTEKAEFEESLLKAAPLQSEPGQPVADMLELNRLRKYLFLRALEWDKRLHYFAYSQQRKPSDAEKDRSNLLKTYSNNEVLQFATKENGSGDDSTSCLNSPAAAAPCEAGSLPDETTCLPVPPSGPMAQDSIDPDILRSLSEADISATLDAAWVGEAHTTDPHTSSNEACSKKEAGQDHPSEGDNEKVDKQKQASPALTPSSSRQSLQSDANTSQSKLSELDEIGNWIGGPYSTLYRGRGSSPKSELRLSEGGSVSRAGQVALEGGARLFFPDGVDGIVVPVYEDEPTSVIANALVSQQYATEISSEKDKRKDRENGDMPAVEDNSVTPQGEEAPKEKPGSLKEPSVLKENPLLNSKQVNLKIENSEVGPEAKLKYTMVAYYSKQFDALRKKCCDGDLEVVRSLSRCKKWGAQGGKSNVFFAKTLDDRFIIKQVTRTELLSFLDFAPEYFKYLYESLNSGSPTCLAKILGMFQVVIKQLKGGKEIRMDVMVMENLLYARHPTRLYDLKGSLRSRYNSDASGQNAVLLDQNLLESMPTAPIFVGNKAKRLLERAVWNDTSFLANIDVMDYSLLVGIDEERGELVLGIIDFMRQYTWDKHLETWVKASGILGGPKNAPPTVISPKQYKKRFRKAMSTYFVTVPDQWTPPSVISAPHVDNNNNSSSSSSNNNNEQQQQQQQQ